MPGGQSRHPDKRFSVNISGGSPGALDGVKMVLDELPSEISFHIPEIYHKRIIGVGGKNIQRIMKLVRPYILHITGDLLQLLFSQYGVYVKFSSAEELTAFGGYADLHNNVVARTPAKNAHALEQLRQAIVEDVLPRDKDFVSEQVLVPRRYHRVLQGEKAIFLHDIEAKTNSEIRFPPRELGNDMITIYGPESQIHLAAQMLLVSVFCGSHEV